jgi:hypothetical protein
VLFSLNRRIVGRHGEQNRREFSLQKQKSVLHISMLAELNPRLAGWGDEEGRAERACDI